MKLEDMFKVSDARAQLLHLQQFIIEWYRDGVVETELKMLLTYPALEVTINLGYWKEVINAVYVASRVDHSYEFSLIENIPPYTNLKRSGFDCGFSQVSRFPAWFEGALGEPNNWHHTTSLFDVFTKHNDIKKLPLNFSVADSHTLISCLLTREVEVEHTSCMTLPTKDALERDDRAKTHIPAWVGWNETPTIRKYNDAYIIWVER